LPSRHTARHIHCGNRQLPKVVAQLQQELARYQATAVPPVEPHGCEPVLDKQKAWQPCDAPKSDLLFA